MTRSGQGPSHPLDRYLVEVIRPPTGSIDVVALAERARSVAAGSDPARPVRFIRAVAVPEDGSCLLLFEGRQRAHVKAAATLAGIGVQRLIRVIRIAPGDPPHRPNDQRHDERSRQ